MKLCIAPITTTVICVTTAMALGLSAQFANADEPVVETVHFHKSGDTWAISVTISHTDTGWDDYADGWRILAPDGSELAMRILYHPHVNEQPFTRSLANVSIPDDMGHVLIQAHTNSDGWAKDTVKVMLPQ